MTINNVDTRHGTYNREEFSNGNTLPYTGVPFGMNYFTVQNQNNTNWHFDPTLPLFQGIRLTHQPSPWMGDFNAVLFTPLTGVPETSDLAINQSSYDMERADFKPHYLKLDLLRYRLQVEVAPTTRGTKVRLTNRHHKKMGFMLQTENESEISIDYQTHTIFTKTPHAVNDGQSVLNFYTTIDFADVAFEVYELNSEDEFILLDKENESLQGKALYIQFLTDEKSLEFSLGTSFISQRFALRNLEQEVLASTYDEIVAQSEKKWNELLRKIKVKDRNPQKMAGFNQYLYRVFLFPQKFYEYDEDGTAVHFNVYDESMKSGKFYTNIGFWDAYKTIFPLYSIILPEFYQDVLEGIENFYEATTHLPKWLSPDERGLMPGTQVSAVIADAAVKDLMDERQMEVFLEALIKEATVQSDNPHFGRRGILDTKEYGYVTITEEGSVNQTQDNAYSDFCIRQVANVLGETDVAEKYAEESLNYRHLFDPETGFLRGKDETGEFIEPFLPEDWSREYVEASPWVNSLAVFHNFSDFIDLFGGKEAFENHLVNMVNKESVFELSKDGFEYNEVTELALGGFGQLTISNQPGFHLPYLYSYVGKPEYTQLLVRQMSEQLFSTGFDGYPGDEDNGSMSGWYIFSSMGFYPVTPGTNQYVLGMPQFDEVTLHLPNDKTFTIKASRQAPQNQFIKSKQLNNEKFERLYLTHDEILEGGVFEVNLSVLPEKQEYTTEQLPYSLNNEEG